MPSRTPRQQKGETVSGNGNTQGNRGESSGRVGSAWTLSQPLGTHIDSEIDTALYNYQRSFVTVLNSDAWASTGQFSGPGINMIWFRRPRKPAFLFYEGLERWIPSFGTQKFYNVYAPYTQLNYAMGFGTEERTDWLNAVFAGNVNKRIGIGAHVDYPYTKGSYSAQAAKELAFGVSGYYSGDRYEIQAFYNHWNHVNKESGGITDDLYITDPAKLQGGVTSIEPKSIPVNLNDAHNRLTGSEFYMSHSYKTGYWKEITSETDTTERSEFVTVMKFTYSLDWCDNHRFFINRNATEGHKFWENTYFDMTGTREDAYYWSVKNSFGIEMAEGFRKWAKFGLSAYLSHETAKYKYGVNGMENFMPGSQNPENGISGPTDSEPDTDKPTTTPLPDGWNSRLQGMQHRLWAGGRIEKTRGAILRYSADARFGLLGDVAGDVEIGGTVSTRFRLGKDTVRISAEADFSNVAPNYMYNHYTGNHFYWNNDFGKQRNLRATGSLYIPWSRTTISGGVENVQNYLYFNSHCLPAQYGGNIQIVSAAIDQKLKGGIWHWDNTLTWQKSSKESVLPLPPLSLYSNMYLYFHAFKALTVQVGIDCNWYSRYKGLAYQPATMTFHTQGAGGVKTGNYLFSDVYLTCKLYQVRFFLMCTHLNQDWFSNDYFSLPHYPIDPRQFRLGISIDFSN